MAKLPESINLLEPVNAPEDVWDRTYNWLFSVGKYIIISVQVVVLGVFLTRFAVDRTNNQLAEDINNQVAVLNQEQYRIGEIRYQNMHSLLADVENLETFQGDTTTYVSTVIEGIPNDLELQRMSYSLNSVSLSFTADTFDQVNAYESRLRRNPLYQNIRVSLNKSGSDVSEINFSVSYDIVEPGADIISE